MTSWFPDSQFGKVESQKNLILQHNDNTIHTFQ